MLTLKLKKSEDKQFYFTLGSENHLVVLTSETYKKKSSAIKSMKMIRESMMGELVKNYYIDYDVRGTKKFIHVNFDLN